MATSHTHDGHRVIVQSGLIVDRPTAGVQLHTHDPVTGDAVWPWPNHHHDKDGNEYEPTTPSPPPVEVTQFFEGERIAGGLLSDRQVALACATMLARSWGQDATLRNIIEDANTFLAFLRADDNETEA